MLRLVLLELLEVAESCHDLRICWDYRLRSFSMKGMIMNPLLQEIYSTILPSAPYIIAAYALVWLVLGVWMFMQFRKQSALQKQIMLLEETVEDARSRTSSELER